MNPDEMRSLIETYLTAYNQFDIDGMVDLLHPEIVFQNIFRGEVNAEASGMDEFTSLARQSRGLFSWRRQSMTAFHSQSDQGTIEVSFEGCLAADLPNGMKKGAMIFMQGKSDFVFREGRIYRITDISG